MTSAAIARGILVAHLDVLLPDLAGISVGVYWPFRGEPDLRGWAAAIRARGATCALPVVVEKNAPLIFRLWRIGEPLALGSGTFRSPPIARNLCRMW